MSTINLPRFVKYDDRNQPYLDWEDLEECQRLSTRIGIRQTCVNLPYEHWNETQLEERLIGVSATGWYDMFDLLGINSLSAEATEIRQRLREIANKEADSYSQKLDLLRPLLVTTLKPEGSTSSVYGCSSGLHPNWSPYYIRRMRITSKDALAQVLLDQGYPCYPEIYDLDKLAEYADLTDLDPWQKLEVFSKLALDERKKVLNQCNTIVFEFPVKSDAKKTQAEITALEQLENTRLFAVEYTDHMPSSTVTVKEHEWEEVINWLDKNWNNGFITVSFLSYFDSQYPLLPYESVGRDEYVKRLGEIPTDCIQVLENGQLFYKVDMNLLSSKERKIDDPDATSLEGECSTGACPIR